MTTLYLSPKYTDDSQLLLKGAIKLGWDVMRLSWNLMNHMEPTEVKDRVIYGEMLFLDLGAKALKLDLIAPPVDFLKKLPLEFVKREIKIWKRSKVVAGTGPLFVKPLSSKGKLEARVYDNPHELQLEDNGVAFGVILSEPVVFSIEFRTFCYGGKMKTLSPYIRDGRLETEADTQEWLEAEEFGNKVAKVGGVLPMVIDIGKIEGRGWAVVEANDACGSGLVGCDPIEALGVIEKACKNERN